MRRGRMFGGYQAVLDNPGEEMARYASGTLGDLPEADSSLRIETSDEDVLADIEALLEE